jgi:hypothetical protein
MTDSSTRARRRRRGWAGTAIGVVLIVAVVVGLRVVPSLLDRGAASAVVTAAVAEIRDLPGVTSATSDLEQRIRTRSVARRHLLGTENGKPVGEVAVAVTLDEGLTAAELAHVLESVRSAFDEDALDRHVLSISYVQRGTDLRIFDGRGTSWEPKDLTGDAIAAIAAHALTLPPGAWFDLDPTTFEQGQFDRIGPSIYADLLGVDVARGYSIGAAVEADTTTAFLDEVERMTAAAAADLDGPTALHLTGPGEAEVFTATAPPELAGAFDDIAASVRGSAEPDTVSLSFVAAIEWKMDLEGGEPVPTVVLTIAATDPSVACSSVEHLVEDAERAFDDRSIGHTVTSTGCVPPA